MARGCSWLWASLWRRKEMSAVEANATSRLARRLTGLELAALGLATTFGYAVFVTAKETTSHTGPVALVSFLIAGIAAVFPALCFAELAARFPLCGSGYLFAFATCGELIAFVAGWSTTLGHAAAASAFAKAWSVHLDRFVGQNVSHIMRENTPIDVSGFAKSFDPLALGITFLVSIGLVMKIRHSSVLNFLFTIINVILVTSLFIMAATNFDLANWTTGKSSNTKTIKVDKFAPLGASGILKAAEMSFPVFIGFDVIATAAEEALTPASSMPCSMLANLSSCALGFALISCAYTLTSCFLQFGCSFLVEALSWPGLTVLTEVAGLFALASCIFGALYALSRAIFAMARDGLIFRCLAWKPEKLQTPIVASIFAALLVALTSSLADMEKLQPIGLMSAGLFVSFSLAPLSLVLLRGSFDLQRKRKEEAPPAELETCPSRVDSVEELMAPSDPMLTCCKMLSCRSFFYHLFVRHSKTPTPISQRVTIVVGTILFVLIFAFAGVLTFLPCGEFPFIISASVIGAVCLLMTIILQIQPQDCSKVTFKVPLVPWVPAISMFITIYLMLQLDKDIWIRYAVWMGVGIILYFFYGIANSKTSSPQDPQKAQKVSSWILESRNAGRLGELSRVTEQTDNGLEESVTQF